MLPAWRVFILAAVATELSGTRSTAPVVRGTVNWERRLACWAASLLATSMALNIVVSWSGEARLARLFEGNTHRQIAEPPDVIASWPESSSTQRLARQLLTMAATLTSQHNGYLPADQLQ